MRPETLAQAIAASHQAAAVCGYCARYTLAQSFERAGMADSTLVYAQQWADGGENAWEAGIYDLNPPLAYIKLGELYEARGERTKAVDYYGRFTSLWREADPEFQPKVKDIRRRIAELSAEPRRP